jgi:poly(3-hydroxybutyrate) depolymerase
MAASPDATVQQTLQVNATSRYYLLYVPPSATADVALPLIFVFHGLNMNNVWASLDQSPVFGSFRLKALSNGQAILVFPEGSGDAPGTTPRCPGCSGGTIASSWNANAADLGFFDALLADIESKHCVDTTRVFATGFSMGGMFSNALGCQRGDVLRAIAPVSGWGPGSAPAAGSTPTCPNGRGDVAALATHGTADGTVPYAAGQASAEFWRTRNGCTATSTPSLSACISYQGCRADLPVGFCTHSGNHAVPTAAGPNIWAFFNSFR